MEHTQVEVQIQAIESALQKLECRICGIQECRECYNYVKKERIKNGLFIAGSSVSMIGLIFLVNPISFTFIGLGLTCGTLTSLIYNAI